MLFIFRLSCNLAYILFLEGCTHLIGSQNESILSFFESHEKWLHNLHTFGNWVHAFNAKWFALRTLYKSDLIFAEDKSLAKLPFTHLPATPLSNPQEVNIPNGQIWLLEKDYSSHCGARRQLSNGWMDGWYHESQGVIFF